MKKTIMILSFISSTFCFAQQKDIRKFQLSAGSEYRITPFNFEGDREGIFLSSRPIFFNRDLQLGGLSINIGLDWFFLKNTSFGINQSFRYDQIFYKTTIQQGSYYNNKLPQNGLILDTELQAKHYFTLKNNDKVFINLGYNIMNQNTDYSTTYQNSENDELSLSENSFRFDAYKIGAGYQYKKLEIGLGIYVIDNPSNIQATNETSVGMPYLKLNYIFSKF